MTADYTLISLVGIISIAIVAIVVVALVGLFCYKYEKLRIKSDANLNANLQDGKIGAEMAIDMDVKNEEKQ
ncbi:TPA: hypothetical protein N2D99_002084 [Clostridium botulinum]|nr:hypothetical protein [Clostridium botulinum]